MSVKVDIKLDADSIADYMIYNVYSSIAGVISVVLGVLNIGLAVAFATRGKYFNMLLFIAFSILIICVFPYMIRRNVKKQVDGSRQTSEIVTYEFTEDGIMTTTTDDSGKASWSKFRKAVSRKYILILYADDKQAIILPIEQLGDQYPQIVEMIYDHMPAPAVRIRRSVKGREKND